MADPLDTMPAAALRAEVRRLRAEIDDRVARMERRLAEVVAKREACDVEQKIMAATLRANEASFVLYGRRHKWIRIVCAVSGITNALLGVVIWGMLL